MKARIYKPHIRAVTGALGLIGFPLHAQTQNDIISAEKTSELLKNEGSEEKNRDVMEDGDICTLNWTNWVSMSADESTYYHVLYCATYNPEIIIRELGLEGTLHKPSFDPTVRNNIENQLWLRDTSLISYKISLGEREAEFFKGYGLERLFSSAYEQFTADNPGCRDAQGEPLEGFFSSANIPKGLPHKLWPEKPVGIITSPYEFYKELLSRNNIDLDYISNPEVNPVLRQQQINRLTALLDFYQGIDADDSLVLRKRQAEGKDDAAHPNWTMYGQGRLYAASQRRAWQQSTQDDPCEAAIVYTAWRQICQDQREFERSCEDLLEDISNYIPANPFP